MSSKIGLRVVRGPDWKWGDQDGGEGFAGTVTDVTLSGPKSRSVAVVWDSGFKGHYRAGPKGHYDLRREKHRNVSCGHASCSTKVIRGLRWKCVDCELNLCTSCFMKKVPHQNGHNNFQRFDNPLVTDPETVSSQPENRIKLMGIFQGAEVIKGPFWPYSQEDKVNIGVVCSDLTEKKGEILVDWLTTKERSSERRCTPNGKLLIRVKEAAVAGFYSPECLPVVENSAGTEQKAETFLSEPSEPGLFSLGDRVLVDPGFNRKGVKKQLIGAVGTVVDFFGKEIVVKFRTIKQRLNQEILRKINLFSVNDIIRIKDDEATTTQIKKELGQIETMEKKLEGAVGRVTGIDMEDASKVYVKFDRDYNWLVKGTSLPSGWMEKFQNIQPAFVKEIDAWIAKGSSLFLTAIQLGDLRSAQLLFKKDNSVTEAVRNEDGKNALHIACIKGYKDVACWLIDNVMMDKEERDYDGFRPIHHAIQEGNLEILEFLLQRNVQLDVLTLLGKSPLHIAVQNEMTEMVRLLIQHGCDVNVEDRYGCTPLNTAIYQGIGPAIIQLLIDSSSRNNWELKNSSGFNILHVAVIKNDLRSIQLILNHEDQGLVLDPLPDTQSTVLHYACIHRNLKVAELLINHQKGAEVNPSVPSRLEELLEARNTCGMTALLIAVSQRDWALIELLVGAGADVKAADENGDTALVIAVTNPSKQDCNPPMDLLSPALLKVLEKNPTLYFLAYLIEKGFCWITANSSGITPADYLSSKGCLQEAKILNDLSAKMRFSARRSSGGAVCMGQDDCIHPPIFQMTCPHKPTFKACSKCFMKSVEAAKCGCADEDVASIVPTVKHEVIQLSDDDIAVKPEPLESEEDSSSSSEEEEKEEEAKRDDDEGEPTSFYSIRSYSDGSKNGYCKDDIGNKYFYRSTRTDGSITYRCIEVSAGKRCPGVACKLGKKITLEIPHEHFSQEKKKKKKKKKGSLDGSPFPKRKKSE